MDFSAFRFWLPYKIFLLQNQIFCRWFFAGEKPFTEPFFDETIVKCLSHPSNSSRFKSVSQLELLPQAAQALSCLRPTAFVFHVSRCGSTMISQLLSLSRKNIVLSEAPFLDSLLRLPYQDKHVSTTDSDRYFSAALSLYGQKREESQQHLVVKADSWHILFYQRLRRLYPDIPFVLLYRRPDEVIRSHQKKRGIHAIPGLLEKEIFGFHPSDTPHTNLDRYLVKVLEKYFTTYAEIARYDKNVLLVNYNEGMLKIIKKIASLTNIRFSAEEWELLTERVAFEAKYPDLKFSAKESSELIPDYLQRCFQQYQQVEILRCSGEKCG